MTTPIDDTTEEPPDRLVDATASTRKHSGVTQSPPPPGLRVARFQVGAIEVVAFVHPLEDPFSEHLEALPKAQRAVVDLAIAGRSTRDIAALRRISEATVKKHLEQAYKRLGVGSRAELAVAASRAGYTPSSE